MSASCNGHDKAVELILSSGTKADLRNKVKQPMVEPKLIEPADRSRSLIIGYACYFFINFLEWLHSSYTCLW